MLLQGFCSVCLGSTDFFFSSLIMTSLINSMNQVVISCFGVAYTASEGRLQGKLPDRGPAFLFAAYQAVQPRSHPVLGGVENPSLEVKISFVTQSPSQASTAHQTQSGKRKLLLGAVQPICIYTVS